MATTGRRPTNSGIRPNLIRSSGSTSRSTSPTAFSVWLRTSAPKPMPAALRAVADDLLEAVEGAAADEQDVGRVDLHELLVRVLAAALRRHVGDRALDHLQQRLLHALARHVAGDRRVVGLARDLVDLVDVDDAALRLLDIVVAVLQQLQDDVLDVLADVAGLGQRGGVGDRERHVQHARQRLGEQRLAGAGGPDQQDVALGELDLVLLALVAAAACSGCRPRPTGSSWPSPGRSRTGRGSRRSRPASAGRTWRPWPASRPAFSSRMMSLHSSMHSSQMNTDGPAISLLHLVLALAAERAVQKLLARALLLGHALSGRALSGRREAPRPRCAALTRGFGRLRQHLVDQAVAYRIFRAT